MHRLSGGMTAQGPEPADAAVSKRRLFRPEVLDDRRARARNHDIARGLSWSWIVILILLASIELLAFLALLSRHDVGRDMAISGRHDAGAAAPR